MNIEDLKKYRKLMVYVAGAFITALANFMDINLPFGPDQLVEVLILLLTAVMIERVPNDPPKEG